MHKSKLAGFIIDCQTNDLTAAANFWGAALGLQQHSFEGEIGERYKQRLGAPGALQLEVQAVEHASRVHLDIETDDIDAEVQRLEALGARRVQQMRSWWVMEAPTGQRFCVVQVQTANFDELATQWP